MHRDYFPPCPIDGPILPAVPFRHLGTAGSVPQKCSTCSHLFEGGCTRAVETRQGYLHLDHGPCGIAGPTDPIVYESRYFTAKVSIPRKCAGCVHLVIDARRGFDCGKDRSLWGDLMRGLDWGTWRPDRIYVELPAPKLTTPAMVDAVHDDELVAFIRESRRVNPDVSIAEAKLDFARLRRLVAGR